MRREVQAKELTAGMTVVMENTDNIAGPREYKLKIATLSQVPWAPDEEGVQATFEKGPIWVRWPADTLVEIEEE